MLSRLLSFYFCPRGEESITEFVAYLAQHCTIGPMCTVQENEVLPDYTVIYGTNLRRLDRSGVDDLKLKMVRRQVEVLKKLVPSNLARFQ
jgi:dynactin-6